MALRDAFDTEIIEGCVLVYAVRQGSHMQLKRIRVDSVEDDRVRGYEIDSLHRGRRTIKSFQTCVVVPEVE